MPWFEASDPLSALSCHESAVLSVSLESLDDLWVGVPADGLLNLALLEDVALLAWLVESSDELGSLHVTLPVASGPLVVTSGVGGAGSALVVELLHNRALDCSLSASDPLLSCLLPDGASSSVSEESSDDLGSLVPADVLQVGARLPGGASVQTLGELLHDLGIWEILAPSASGPSLQTIGVGRALLALVVELSDNLAVSSSAASDDSETWSNEKLALSSVSDEVSDESVLGAPADGSGLSILLPNSAVVFLALESSLDLGAGPGSDPVASGPLSETSLVHRALLALSHPDSDDSAGGDLLGGAAGEGADALLVLGADVVVLEISLNDLGSLERLLGLLGAAGELDVASLVISALRSVS